MFIVNPYLVPLHRDQITVGTKGDFVEGVKRVAECEVSAVIALAMNYAL